MVNGLAKDGLRAHFIEKDKSPEDAVGKICTAICGHVWKPFTTTLAEMTDLPLCYGCAEERAVRAMEDFNFYSGMVLRYDREHERDAD